MSDDMVWVKTEPSLDGKTYTVTLEATDDVAVVLDPDKAVRYAWGVLDAAHRAAYDAAVIRQMQGRLKLPMDVIGQLITDLRADRPDLDDGATYPFRLEPGVAARNGKPFLALYLQGQDEQLGQWDFDDARQHALHVMESVKVADLDAAYRLALTSVVGIEDARALNVVDDLGNWR